MKEFGKTHINLFLKILKTNKQLLVLSFLFTVIPINAQSAFYEGTGEALELSQAKDEALSSLSSSIETYINTRFEHSITEENLTITEDYVYSQTQTYSSIVLQNVEYIQEQRERKTGFFKKEKYWFVTARVSRSDVKKAFNERKINILTMIKSGIVAENSGSISEALKNFYWSYILTFTYPDTIMTVLPPHNITGNARILLVDKLNHLLQGLTAEVIKTFIDDDDLVIQSKFNYRGHPVEDLQLTYYDGTEQNYCEILNSRAHLILTGNYSSVQKTMHPLIEYKFESEMPQNTDVNTVYHALSFPQFDNSIPIEIDLSSYVKFDFKAEFQERTVSFSPNYLHLSISSINWEFGDGSSSTAHNPVHTFPENEIYPVKMVINGDTDLKIIKNINLMDQSMTIVETPDVIYPEVEKEVPVDSVVIPEYEKEKFINDPQTQQTLTFKELLTVKNIPQFNSIATELNRIGKIIFGKAGQFESKEGLYCFIFDRENEGCEAVYKYQNGVFINVNSQESFFSLKEKHSGKIAIWVEELKQ